MQTEDIDRIAPLTTSQHALRLLLVMLLPSIASLSDDPREFVRKLADRTIDGVSSVRFLDEGALDGEVVKQSVIAELDAIFSGGMGLL